MKTEHILAVMASHIVSKDIEFNRIQPVMDIDPQHVVVGHRQYLDYANDGAGDRDYLQGIGYAVVTHPEKGILAYRRHGTEHRLGGKISIGFGGHTSISDIVNVAGTEEIDFIQSVNKGMARELTEELVINSGELLDTPRNLGTILCDRTPVDLLHIAFVSEFTLEGAEPDVSLGDHGSFIFWIDDVSSINLDECEEWTKIVLSQHFSSQGALVKFLNKWRGVILFVLTAGPFMFAGLLFGQAGQYLLAHDDVRAYHLEQWKKTHPEQRQVAENFAQTCIYGKPIKNASEMERPRFVPIAECADSIGASEIYDYITLETDNTLHTVMWPLSIFDTHNF